MALPEKLLTVNCFDMATGGEYAAPVADYRRQLEVLGIPDEQIEQMILDNAQINGIKATDLIEAILPDKKESDAKIADIIATESVIEVKPVEDIKPSPIEDIKPEEEVIE